MQDQQVCHFWRLPPEIRLMIYDIVYGRGKLIRMTPVYKRFRPKADSHGETNLVLRGHKVSRAQH